MSASASHEPSARSPEDRSDFAIVYEARDEMEAQIVREVLRDAGIPVIEVGQVGALYPFPIGPLADESVAVPADRREEALRVLRETLESAEGLKEEVREDQNQPGE